MEAATSFLPKRQERDEVKSLTALSGAQKLLFVPKILRWAFLSPSISPCRLRKNPPFRLRTAPFRVGGLHQSLNFRRDTIGTVKANSASFGSDSTFDLFRIGRAKKVVDLSDNTIRKFIREGLPCYRRGKAIFISKRELDQFIRFQPATPKAVAQS